MKLLFRLATNYFTLDWHRVGNADRPTLPRTSTAIGRLRLVSRSNNLEWLDATYIDGVASVTTSDLADESGPALFEQTEYQLYLRTTNANDQVEIRHRDPMITRKLNAQEGGRVLHGSVNFRGQIGRSLFSVYVNGRRILDFEVEVFPTKIDYETDYHEILSDVQSILTSLAYEYLRSTYQLGRLAADQQPSRLEWLVLIEHIVDELEKAMNHIAQRPIRALVRLERSSRLERIRRVDSRVRSQIRRGQGKGRLVHAGQVMAREKINQRPAELTLDTLEHRWLRNQLVAIQRNLSQISKLYDLEAEKSERRKKLAHGVFDLKSRVSRLTRLEPMGAASGNPPAGFASLQLVSAPGYREAYRLLVLLRMGLRLEGDLLQLSAKDLEVLYEYWTYLTVVRTIRDEHGAPLRLDQLFKLNRSGLTVQLKQGKGQRVSFRAGEHRKVHVVYNPQFSNRESTLIPQKPDILIRLEEDGWPLIQLVADAKYRIDASEEYRRQFGSFGPPKDAINVLHRYRDAILEFDKMVQEAPQLKRSVVQAAALFPMNGQPDEDFRESRLWMSLDRLGVGAIPLLPTNAGFLKEWLLGALRQGGWSMADRAIANFAEERARDWRIAASEPVLVGVLRSPGTRQHFQWVRNKRMYYQPRAKTQRRQKMVRKIAFYIPASQNEPNGIRYIAEIDGVEFVDRKNIETPWRPKRNDEMVLYHLGPVKPLARPIEFASGDTIRQSRWTSRLGLERARTLGEIALETEPEWRLFEWLTANKIGFSIRLSAAKLQAVNNPKGRAWFELESNPAVKVRYDGSNRFLVKMNAKEDLYLTVQDLADLKNML